MARTTRRVAMVLLTLVAIAACASAAHAAVLGGGPFTRPWQAWTNESQMPMAPGPITFEEFSGYGPCDGDPGCTQEFDWLNPAGQVNWRTFVISITRSASSSTLRHYLWHEETHVFDAVALTNYWRAQIMALYGLPGGPDNWLTSFGKDGRDAAEWFAEAGALCDKYGLNIGELRGVLPMGDDDWTVYGFPGWENMPALVGTCRIIVAAGRTAGLPVPVQRAYPRAQASGAMGAAPRALPRMRDFRPRRRPRPTSGVASGHG